MSFMGGFARGQRADAFTRDGDVVVSPRRRLVAESLGCRDGSSFPTLRSGAVFAKFSCSGPRVTAATSPPQGL